MKLEGSTLRNIVLVVLALVTTGIVAGTRHSATTAEAELREKNLLSIWRPDEVARIEISGAPSSPTNSQAHRVVVLVRGPDDGGESSWRIEEPVKEPADPEAVERFVSALGFSTPLRSAPEEPTAAGIGPESPTLRLELGSIGYELRLGKAAAAPSGSHFLSVQSKGAPRSGMFVVSHDVAELFESTVDSFRTKSLWAFGEMSLHKLTLRKSGDARFISLEKSSGASWKLASGERASRENIDRLLVGLSRLTAERFLEPSQADALFKTSGFTSLHAEPIEGSPVDLEFGPPCPAAPELVAVRKRGAGDVSACSPRSVLDGLDLTTDAFVDQRLFSVRNDEVETVALDNGGKRLVLTRKGSGFLMREPKEAQVALDAGNARLDAMLKAPGVRIKAPDLKGLGLDPPAGKVTVTSPSGEKTFDETLELGKTQPDGVLPVRRSDGAVFGVDKENARAFSADSMLLRGLTLLSFSSSELVSLETDRPEPQLVERVNETYALKKPHGFQLDGGMITDLGFELGALTALRWAADSDDGSFGLASPVVTAKIGFKSGDAGVTNRELIIGSPTSGGQFARLADDPAVFVIDRQVAEHLTTLFLNRSVFMLDPSGIDRLVLTRHGQRIELQGHGGKLTSSVPGIDQGQLQLIADTLSTLRAEAALHTGKARAAEGFDHPELEVEVVRDNANGGPVKLTIGSGDTYRDLGVSYARVSGVDATYVITKSKLRPLLDAF